MEPREGSECGTAAGTSTPSCADSHTRQPPAATEEANRGEGGGVDLFHGEDADGCCCSSSADDDLDFEFEFAPLPPPSTAGDADEGTDDLFDAAGRMWPGHHYPVFARPHPDDVEDQHLTSSGSNQRQLDAPPSTSTSTSSHEVATSGPEGGDDYCVWVPKKPPPRAAAAAAGDHPHQDPTWKSLSASAVDASRRWRLRDLMLTPGRSHSDGTEKFSFLVPVPHHHHADKTPRAATAAGAGGGGPSASSKTEKAAPSGRRATENQRQKKGVTEMDIATAHRLFYAKSGGNGGGAAQGGQHQNHRQSYLPYRKDLVGYFSSGGNNGPHTRFLPF